MSSQVVTAYLLHRRAYRESSYLLDIFSLEQGKLAAISKGVRASKSDKKSLLQSFQRLQIGLSGRHQLKNVNKVESLSSALRLQGKALFSAMYINELLNRLLPVDVPHPELFVSYQQSLQALADGELIEVCLRYFEFSLLEELGYGVDLQHECDTNKEIKALDFYTYISERGVQRLAEDAGEARQRVNCFSGASLHKVARQEWDKESLRCAKVIARIALSPLIGDKPLKSRELFKST